MKVLFGNRRAIKVMQWPVPHPTSATRMPASRRGMSPSGFPRYALNRSSSYRGRLRRSIRPVNSGWKALYGTPPPVRNASATSGMTRFMSGNISTMLVRLRLDEPVSIAACSRGSRYVSLARRVLDDPAADHGGQPLPHVALAEPGLPGDLGAGRRAHRGHGLEEADAPADLQHEGHGGALEVAHHELRERLGLRPVELRLGHRRLALYRPRLRPPGSRRPREARSR